MSKTLKLTGVIFFCCLFTLSIYVNSNFQWRANSIDYVDVFIGEADSIVPPVMYLYEDNSLDFTFNKPFKSISVDEKCIRFNLKSNNKLRKLRLDFQKVGRAIFVNDIVFGEKSKRDHIDLDKLQLSDELKDVNNDKVGNHINIKSNNGSFQTSKFYVYEDDLLRIVVFCIALVLVSLLFSYFLSVWLLSFDLILLTYSQMSIALFISSIFLPHPIFNLTLIISVLMVIKDFKLSNLSSNKINLVFIGLFIVLLFNDMFVSESGIHNLKATERSVLFLLLPIYISSIKEVKYLKYFPISAIIIGVGLFLTSMVNAILFKNINYFSFEEFAKYIHPVYFSYLLSFSIFYILLNSKLEDRVKNMLQAVLFFFLILAGSKMIITLTLVIYGVLFVRTKKALLIALFGVICLALFPPIQNRFKEIVNLDDISVVQEELIEDANDPRVNGLTLRLLIWQETIKTVNTLPKLFVGIGLDDAADEALKVNLVNRGLAKYKRYSTHNQFLNAYMRTGVLGLSVLLLLVGSIFYTAIRKKNKMLLIMIVMFTFAMLTESVFQRVLGLYFFTTVLLFLIKPNFLDENSNNWN
ncbi:O-antigen ligase family protein [Vicingaceae bacterium]|nr:O-antigen ligase family protein [Vicingaceae bacterium]